MANRLGIWLLVAACLFTALAARLVYLVRPFDHDAAMFVYLGKSVCDGDRFGHDVTDNKFPSVGLMTSLPWRLFGTRWPAYVILQTFLSVAAALFLARCAGRAAGRGARLPAALAALVYLNFSTAVFGGFQLETLQIFFAVIAACSAVEVLRTASPADAFLVGLASATAALFKPTGLAPAGALAIALLGSGAIAWRRALALAAASAVGALIPVAALLLYLVRFDILRDLPDLYRQISLYASQTPLGPDDLLKPFIVTVLAGFGIAVRGWVLRRQARRTPSAVAPEVLGFAIAWFLLELLGAVMQRRMYAYHFLPVAAPAALIFGLLPRRNTPLGLAAALGPIMLLSLIGAGEVLKYPDPRTPILPASRYLLAHAAPGDAVWQDSMPRLLLETGLRPGARFPLMFLFGNHDSAALEYGPVLFNDLERRRPRFIVLPSDVEGKIRSETTQCAHLARSPVRAANFSAAWRQVARYVSRNYTPEVQVCGETIWRRRSPDASPSGGLRITSSGSSPAP